MVLKTVWRKVRLYKRFELDIWGMRIIHGSRKTKIAKLFNSWDVERAEYRRQKRLRYVYRIDLDQPARVRKRQKWRFVTRRLSRLFYLTLSYSQFRRLANTATKLEGSWESHFIMLVENRLIGMLYRIQFDNSIFNLRWLIFRGKVLVNNKIATYYNAPVHYFDILRFNKREAFFFKYEFCKRIENNIYFFGKPRYLFISYRLMFSFVFKEPKRKDLVFPIKAIDVYRSADYY